MSNQKPPMKKKAENGREARERLGDRLADPVGAAAVGVLVGVRDLVCGDAHRRDAALVGHGLRQPQRARVAVVVVGERARGELDADALEVVRGEQPRRDVGAADAGPVRDRPVGLEDLLDAALREKAADEREEQEQPQERGHRRTV